MRGSKGKVMKKCQSIEDFGVCYFCVQLPTWIQVAKGQRLEPFSPEEKVRVICWIFNNRFKTSNSSDSSQDLQFNWIQQALIWYFSRLGKFFVFYGLTKICEQNTADVKWFYLSHKYLSNTSRYYFYLEEKVFKHCFTNF